ncbi:hypothetical protein A2774_06015 [Candidatus Roizmanbacteria bacterium RIFCSPHIGHO2_01_FULL_39_12c]|uniref:Uncharacterized protein n=1 Tax=Candidatus Roizmanbacteria bacterium RIFCSPHIGHO2_01_FULL_39_12c TaxID=1802031 RepID=A0A1F7G9F1_9BACT|nr:MAG: hypothetical protein A2774_06015 [Candidatus Roizmanbacteria bacterium RIFCSPHIGHO2_01_FULL_39_12c]
MRSRSLQAWLEGTDFPVASEGKSQQIPIEEDRCTHLLKSRLFILCIVLRKFYIFEAVLFLFSDRSEEISRDRKYQITE